MVEGGYINKKEVQNLNGKGSDAFNTKAYLLGLTTPAPGSAAKVKRTR
jgi:hypothetical protein